MLRFYNFAFVPVSNLTILNPYSNRRNFRVCHGLKFRGEVPVVRHFDTDNSQGQPSRPLTNLLKAKEHPDPTSNQSIE